MFGKPSWTELHFVLSNQNKIREAAQAFPCFFSCFQKDISGVAHKLRLVLRRVLPGEGCTSIVMQRTEAIFFN